jgi:hypothetical protein
MPTLKKTMKHEKDDVAEILRQAGVDAGEAPKYVWPQEKTAKKKERHEFYDDEEEAIQKKDWRIAKRESIAEKKPARKEEKPILEKTGHGEQKAAPKEERAGQKKQTAKQEGQIGERHEEKTKQADCHAKESPQKQAKNMFFWLAGKKKTEHQKEEKPGFSRMRSLFRRLAEEPQTKSREETEKEENSMYNAIIISLIAGIVIVIITLIVARPEPEYFTELYFNNHTILPKYIGQGKDYQFIFTVHNVENGTHEYKVKIAAQLYDKNKSARQGFEYHKSIIAAKGELVMQPVTFAVEEPFYRARIQVDLLDKNQEIHFWAYNKDMAYEYPDTIAAVYCLNKTIKIEKKEYITIAAKGALQPAMKVRVNGQQVYSTTLESDQTTNYTINQLIGTGFLDIVFDNYRWNATIKKDTQPTIEYIMIGDTKILPSDGILDGGDGAKAFDCESIQTGKPNLVVSKIGNSALRFRLEEK